MSLCLVSWESSWGRHLRAQELKCKLGQDVIVSLPCYPDHVTRFFSGSSNCLLRLPGLLLIQGKGWEKGRGGGGVLRERFLDLGFKAKFNQSHEDPQLQKTRPPSDSMPSPRFMPGFMTRLVQTSES